MTKNYQTNNFLFKFKYAIGISINCIFILFEFIYGWVANSLAVTSDAVHNLTDVIGISLAFVAVLLQKKRPTSDHTYGFSNATIISSLVNAVILPLTLVGLIVESVIRLFFAEQTQVDGKIVFVISAIGIIINGLTAFLFKESRQHEHDLNEENTYLHFFADAVVSLVVLITGLIIVFTNWHWVDPLMTIVVSVWILFESFPLLKEAWLLITFGVPKGIDEEEVRKYFLDIPEINSVNDLHIWAVSTTETALTAHLTYTNPQKNSELLDKLTSDLKTIFSISHVTIQLEGTDRKHIEPEI